MTQLIVGFGQIGRAIYELLNSGPRRASGIYVYDPVVRTEQPGGSIDVLHVCFPYSDTFFEEVQHYIEQYNPGHIVIWSTVAIGTTRQFPHAVHSPIEGRHPYLAGSVLQMHRWVGYNTEADWQFFQEFFEGLGFFGERLRAVENSDWTEALKLLSTTEYGINIVFADYKRRVAEDISMPYALTKQWNQDYNALYRKLGDGKKYQKFVLDPPKGRIGGHCVIPNAKLLREDYPDLLLDIIKEYE